MCAAGPEASFACASSRFTRAHQLKVFNLVLKEAINCTSELVKLPGKTAACVRSLPRHACKIYLARLIRFKGKKYTIQLSLAIDDFSSIPNIYLTYMMGLDVFLFLMKNIIFSLFIY